MSTSPIKTPSPSDAVNGYQLALENAQRHIRCGEILSQANEHGFATAHLVLAAEEAVKAELLLFVSFGLDVSPETLRPFLTQHLPRQITGAFLVIMEFFLAKWIGLITSLNAEYPDATTKEYQSARRKKVEELIAELIKLENAIPGESYFVDSIAWWGKANDLKQRALYVDFSENTWRGPYSIDREKFDRSLVFAKDVVQTAERIIKTALSDNPRGRQELVETLNQFLKQRRTG